MTVATHFKIVFRGIFENTPEMWTFSTKFSRDNPAGADAGYGDISVSGIDAAVASYIGSSKFTSSVRCTGWRAYVIGTNGLTEGNPLIVEYATGAGPRGTGASVAYPPDVSLCVTTEAANRGHARFGRFYLPMPNALLDNSLRISAATADGYVTDTTNFLKAVADSIDLEGLQSSEMLNISDDVAGTRQTVRNIRVGRVFDRVSRRRRQLLEEYAVSGTIDW